MNNLFGGRLASWRESHSSFISSALGFLFVIALVAFVHFYLQPASQPLSQTEQRLYSLDNVNDPEQQLVDDPEVVNHLVIITIGGPSYTFSATDSEAGPTTWVYVYLAPPAIVCDATTDFTNAISYLEGAQITPALEHDGHRICFRSSTADYDAYAISNPANTKPPTLTVTVASSIVGAAIVSVTYTDIDTDPDTIAYKLFNPNSASCNPSLMSSGTTAGETVTVSGSANNGFKVCFTAADDYDNVAYQSSEALADLNDDAVITISLDKVSISATDNKAEATTWHYLVLDSDDCDSDTDFSSATAYNEAGQLHLDQVNHGGKYFCFRSVDSNSNQGFGSQLVPNRPVVTGLEINRDAGTTYGLGRTFTITVIFSEEVVVSPPSNNRQLYLVVNSRDDRHNFNEYQGFEGNRVEFYYLSHRSSQDYTPDFLEVEAIVADDGRMIQDLDGNDAILSIPASVTLSSFKQIKIDARVTTVTVNNPPNADEWASEKIISATDDYTDNDNLADNGFTVGQYGGKDYYIFEYSLVPAALVDPDYFDDGSIGSRSVDHNCRLNDYGLETHSYIEGSDLVLDSDANDHYICFRSRRGNADLHDLSSDRDWTGVMSNLIHMIDGEGPVITFEYIDNQVTPTVFDSSGVDSASLEYKVVDITSDCSEATLATDTTAYVSGNPIAVSEDDYYQVFCFGAADVLGNKRQVAFYPFQEGSPLMITSITSPKLDGAYGLGESIPIQVTFSGIVRVTAQPQLSLNSGGTANYVSGDNRSSLIFSYQVGAGESSADLDVNSLNLNGGGLIGINSNEVILDMPAGNLAIYKDLVIDTIVPSISLSPVINNQVSATASDSQDAQPKLEVAILTDGLCQATTSAHFISYTPGLKIQLAHGQRACFRATDQAANASYKASTAGVDSGIPTIEVYPASDDLSPKQTITVTATSADPDINIDSWLYKLITAGVSCDATTMATGTTAGSSLNLNHESQNNHRVCFSVSDLNQNDAYGVSGLIAGIDATKPVIAVSTVVNNQVSATVSDNLDNSPYFGYTFLDDYAVCDGSQDSLDYTSGRGLTLPVGQSVCFIAIDAAGNEAYASSQTGGQDLTPPLVTVDLNHHSRQVSAQDDKDQPTSWLYGLINHDQACDGTIDFSQAASYLEAEPLSLSLLHHHRRFCFRSVSQSHVAGYGLSDLVDLEAPLISVTTKANQALARDDDSDPTIWHYQLIDAGSECSAATFNDSLAAVYTEGHALTVKTTLLRQICFRSVDLKSNDSYGTSDTLTITQPLQPPAPQPQPPRPLPQPLPEPEPQPVPQPPQPPQQPLPPSVVDIDDDDQTETSSVSPWLLVGILAVNTLLTLFIFFLFWRHRRQDEQEPDSD